MIIPAYNEEASIGKVLEAIPAEPVREVVVVNNNSTDRTREVAEYAGATVIDETRQGYGSACLRGIAYLKAKENPPDTVVFLDADFSDYPEQMERLLTPIRDEGIDLTIGSRTLGKRSKGALMPQQVFGNKLATWMMKALYGIRYTDLGPFRGIRFQKLLELGMEDPDYGWTVEMQLKAAKMKLEVKEVPVDLRQRIGTSKVAGTFQGTVMAGYKIIKTILSYR
ncbi:MAG: glycosyltransferase family 2 protein [Flavobacteriales bacterium]